MAQYRQDTVNGPRVRATDPAEPITATQAAPAPTDTPAAKSANRGATPKTKE